MQSQTVDSRFGRAAALRRSASPIREQVKRSARLAIFGLLALLAVGCTGIVMEPADESGGSGNQKFWGYAVGASTAVKLEALNSSSAYEVIATATSSATPTSAGDYTGYYFEVWTYLPSLPTRFRKAGPWSGYWTGTFRLTVGGTSMQTRSYNQNSNNPANESWLVNFWQRYSTSSYTTRLYVAN